MSCGSDDRVVARDVIFNNGFDWNAVRQFKLRNGGLWEPPNGTEVFYLFGAPLSTNPAPTKLYGAVVGSQVSWHLAAAAHAGFLPGTPVRLVVKLPTDDDGRLISIGQVRRR
jgi:hypothetical protein